MLPDCAIEIADYYEVHVEVLEAISVVEGGARGVVVSNSNGTQDKGLMQINSWWWTDHPHSLNHHGISKEEVINNDCTNLAVAAYILRLNLDTWGDYESAIRAYNTGSPNRGKGYFEDVLAAMEYIGLDRRIGSEPNQARSNFFSLSEE